ncbi:MAG TPA: DUF3016 domain-containing protein [Hansschlegelia sp.]
MRVPVLLLAAALAGVPSLAAAEVAVRAEPGPYVSSWSFRSAAERDSIFRELARYLERTGGRMLPKGRSASIELVEIDPAGRFEPWRPGFDDVRVLRDVTPPRVKLRYAVTERGRTLARGEETVTDIDYLSNISARSSGDRLAYEKAMLRDWLDDRLVKLKPERR